MEGAGSSVGNVCRWLGMALARNESPKEALIFVSYHPRLIEIKIIKYV